MENHNLDPFLEFHDVELQFTGTLPTDPSHGFEHPKVEEAKEHHNLKKRNPKVKSWFSRTLWYRKVHACWKYAVERRSWRFGLFIGLYTSSCVLIGNIALVLIGSFSHGGIKNGIGTLAVGDGVYIRRLGASYHVLINIISTILLISSNYAMQILCAPIREELDKAHQKGDWLDIGVISIHNLRHIQRRRVVLWSLLAFSSIPLHLL
jgi:hypothetical protein